MKPFTLAAALGLAMLTLVECKPNAAATAKCKGQTSSKYACSNCCQSNGASGHNFVQGSTCECLN
jgi:hypothetical protein